MALDEHLASKSERAIAIYRAVEAAIAACGEFRIHPQKTRISFIARMTFAGIRLARRWADLSFILPTPLDDAGVRKIDLYGPTSFGHEVRLTGPDDVDDAVGSWLCQAHTRGEQKTLDPRAEVNPVVGRALEHLMAPLRTRVVGTGEGLAVTVPTYVAQAFGAHPQVVARIQGDQYPGEIRLVDGEARLFLGDALQVIGLGVGEAVDAFLAADL